MVSLIQTTIGTILGPLVSELAASRQANEQLTGQLVRQSETIGQLRAENRALLAPTAPQSVEPTNGEPPTPLSRLLALWRWLVLVVVVAITTATVLLAWPR